MVAVMEVAVATVVDVEVPLVVAITVDLW